MTTAFNLVRFTANPLIGIIRLRGIIDCEALVSAALKAGLTNLEVSLTYEGSERQLEAIVSAAGPQLNVGAGTVTSLERLTKAREAGASFIVTPSLNSEIASAVKAAGLAFFPGAYTPTEIVTAQKSGATMVKLFPAITLGPNFVSQLTAAMPEIRLLPTGGITCADIPTWKEAGAAGLGLGDGLFPAFILAAKDWPALTRHIRTFVASWHAPVAT